MRCFTAEKGVVTAGIQLWQDGDKCFVHVRPDIWMPVHSDLLNSTSLDHIERRADGQIILHRASTHVIGNHVQEFIPETAGSADRVCVLAHIGLDLARFTAACPAPTVPYTTALGLNFYSHPLAANRITHDKVGEGAVKLDHEEYSLVAGMGVGDHVRVQVIFQAKERDRFGSQIDPWVEGTFLSYHGGNDVRFNQIEARSMAERYAAGRVYVPTKRAA
jgi:hypothetical protein